MRLAQRGMWSTALTPPQSRIETSLNSHPGEAEVRHSPRHSRGLRHELARGGNDGVRHSPRHSRGLRRRRTRVGLFPGVRHSPRHSRGLRLSSSSTAARICTALTPPQSRIETGSTSLSSRSFVRHSPRHSRGLRRRRRCRPPPPRTALTPPQSRIETGFALLDAPPLYGTHPATVAE